MQLEPQLGEPAVALVELPAQLGAGIGVRVRLLRGRGRLRRAARRLELLKQGVALVELAAQRREALLVFLDLRVDRLGLRAPEIDLFLGQLLGA